MRPVPQPGSPAFPPPPTNIPPVSPPARQSNSLPITSLSDIFGSQMNPSLVQLQDHFASKYSSIYWSRADTKGTRSIAAYTLQCLQFERLLRQEKREGSMRLMSESLQFSLDWLKTPDLLISNPDYEEHYREEIAFIETQLPQLTNSDMQPLCSQLNAC